MVKTWGENLQKSSAIIKHHEKSAKINHNPAPSRSLRPVAFSQGWACTLACHIGMDDRVHHICKCFTTPKVRGTGKKSIITTPLVSTWISGGSHTSSCQALRRSSQPLNLSVSQLQDRHFGVSCQNPNVPRARGRELIIRVVRIHGASFSKHIAHPTHFKIPSKIIRNPRGIPDGHLYSWQWWWPDQDDSHVDMISNWQMS